MSTKIEWTDETWNPVSGCTKVSEGCDHCYIERTPPFRMNGRKFLPLIGQEVGKSTGVQLHTDRLERPLSWRKPRRVFVNSLSDLFHADVPDEYIAQVFAVMARASQHTFQILTKRPARMRALLNSLLFRRQMYNALVEIDYEWIRDNPLAWPLPNVWLGTSVESQKWADIRIPLLLGTPAAVRFLSCEPLLGPIDITGDLCTDGGSEQVDWVIVGGESGPRARPMNPQWARSLRDQCTQSGITFHFKQWGEWTPEDQSPEDAVIPGRIRCHEWPVGPDSLRLGKHIAGRELDGRTWDEFPAATQKDAR